jgi:hypothetical protein
MNRGINNRNINNTKTNNLLKKYVNDIKNMICLDDKKIENIKNMNEEEKIEIIITLNNVIKSFREILNYHELK